MSSEYAKAPGKFRRGAVLAGAVLRNVPKFAHALPPFRNQTMQRFRERAGIPTRAHISRAPFDLAPSLASRIRELGLTDTVASLRERGFGQINDLADPALTGQLREKILTITSQQPAGKATRLLDSDPIFEQVVLNPSILALVEVMCGKGALLSKMAGRVLDNNAPASHLHVTQNDLPAPFPDHNQMVTFCWACDEQSDSAGAITVVPESHRHRRPPNQAEIDDPQGELVPASAGCVTVFDGSLWHGRHRRQIDGQQVLLYVTFCRLAMHPQESYFDIAPEWLHGKPFELSVLLGLEDGMDTGEGVVASVDNFAKFARMNNWSKT